MPVPYKLNYFEIETGIDSTSTFIHTGDLTATKVKKYLATSNDILLGDGTTTSLSGLQSAITLTTTGTSGAATLIGATLNIPNYGGALSGYVPYTGATQALNLGTNNGILLTDTSSNSSIAITSSSTGSGAIVVNKSVNGQGVTVNNAGIGSGFYANNSSTGNGVLIGNASTGKGLVIDNAALAIGDPFVYTLGGAAFVKAKIDYLGNITGNSFVKTGGTSSQFLKADGSVDSTAYGTGSVTSVAALTLGTTGTDLSSTVANGSTTPVITLNVPDAGATARGVVTTGTQSFAGDKTFIGTPILGSTAGDLFWTSFSSSSTQRRGLLMSDGATINMQIYTGGNSTLGAFTEGIQTLVIGTGVAGGGGSGEKILFHSTGRGNMFSINAATQVNTSYFSLNAAAGLTGTTANFTGQLTLGSTITNGTYTYTLPSATGTIALVGGAGVGTVTSVGLSMPAAFSVASSPVTSAGTIAVTGAGLASQYIRGDGALGDFPNTGGGGSSVSYYLNGSVNQGTFVGNTYYEMNKTPVIGAGTDFTINANGYIAQFITDANDPASLLIPGGNWNVEMYFSASSNGGSPSFYVEVYKYDGSAFTLLGSSSATPEGITNGTAIDIYYTSVAIPETVLTITDRLAIRVYVTHSGRTITLHTEDNHLSEIVTTFSNGLTALNGLTKQVQFLAVGTSGTDFNISSSVDTHTFNLPTASATNRGALSFTDWTTFNSKQNTITLTTTGSSGASTFMSNTLNVPDYTLSGLGGVPTSRQLTINGTAYDLSADRSWSVGTVTSVAALTLGTSGTDLSSTVANGTTTPVITLNVPTASATNRGALSSGDWSTFNGKESVLTFSSPLVRTTNTISIPVATTSVNGYLSSVDWTTFNGKQNALTNPVTGTGTTNTLPKFTGASTIGDSAITDDGTTVTLVSRALSGTSATFSGNVTLSESGSNNHNLIFNQLSGSNNIFQGIDFKDGNNIIRSAIKQEQTNFATGLTDLVFYNGTTSLPERMRLFSSGNFAIGTSTDGGAKLQVNGRQDVVGVIRSTAGSAPSAGSGAEIAYSGGTGYFLAFDRTTSTYLPVGINGSTVTISTGALATPALTIASTGTSTFKTGTNENVSILSVGGGDMRISALNDAASANVQLSIQGSPLLFRIGGGVEAMRITSAAETLFNTTNNSSTAGNGFKILTGGEIPAVVTAASTDGGRTSYTLYSTGAAAFRFYVGAGGTIFATSTSISAISDISLKTNIRHLDKGLDEIMKLKPRRFDWKNGDNDNVMGFIAQEVEEIFPELIGEYKYNETESKKSLKMGDLLPSLVKAIQELKAEIDLLKGIVPIEPMPIVPGVTNQTESESEPEPTEE